MLTNWISLKFPSSEKIEVFDITKEEKNSCDESIFSERGSNIQINVLTVYRYHHSVLVAITVYFMIF